MGPWCSTTRSLFYIRITRARVHVKVKRKTELEAKLKEIEDAIAIFSKEKVYIADD
jgi:hypothetical protein